VAVLLTSPSVAPLHNPYKSCSPPHVCADCVPGAGEVGAVSRRTGQHTHPGSHCSLLEMFEKFKMFKTPCPPTSPALNNFDRPAEAGQLEPSRPRTGAELSCGKLGADQPQLTPLRFLLQEHE